MAPANNLPCDGDGICMICKVTPPSEETLTCKTCVTPWHVACLSSPPANMSDVPQWECPDCSELNPTGVGGSEFEAKSDGLIAAIRAIQTDDSLSELEKAKKRQLLLSGGAPSSEGADMLVEGDKNSFNGKLTCTFCMQLPDRPVTTPCGHNFCLKCFQRWINQGKRKCANCRKTIPHKMAIQPRINSTLVIAIRAAKMSKSNTGGGPPKTYNSVRNENRPEKAYTTERAKKAGKANACSGKIFVTVPPDHFGPILAENDPMRNQGVLVGESWEDRLECRQWGTHLPHVAGIAGQSAYGAQSVALSGGYIDDEDHGEWFLYTGSGGRDLSGNKRTNKEQSFDQKFEKLNEALRVSCRKGYPVRVVRSHKEKRSSYAPEKGVRYDGVYRIEKCWRKNGVQGHKVCRYLFVRCDNEPAPWTSDDHGDCPRPLPVIGELENAIDVTERRGSPSWDYDEGKGCWIWKKPPPCSRKQGDGRNPEDGMKMRRIKRQVHKKLPKELSCQICLKVMTNPITTPCAHNFCKGCLEGFYAGQSFTRQRTCHGGRTLRTQKTVMKCPSCTNDIAEYLQHPQVNRELMSVIESLQHRDSESENVDDSTEESDDSQEKTDAVADSEIKTCNVESEILEETKDDSAIQKEAKDFTKDDSEIQKDAKDTSEIKEESKNNSEVQKEAKNLIHQAETEPLQTCEMKHESSGNDMSNIARQQEGKLAEQPNNICSAKAINPNISEMVDGIEQPATAKVKRNYRKKRAGDEGSQSVDTGVQTRSKKAKK